MHSSAPVQGAWCMIAGFVKSEIPGLPILLQLADACLSKFMSLGSCHDGCGHFRWGTLAMTAFLKFAARSHIVCNLLV